MTTFELWGWMRVVRDSDLSLTAKAVAYTLATYARKKDGRCRVLRRTIAAGVGRDVRTVSRAVVELERAQLLDVQRDRDGSSIYTPRFRDDEPF
jgi:hypothetical protein